MIRSGLKRRTGIRKVNRKRRAAAFEANFGPKAQWIRSLPCCVSGAPPPSEAAHVKSRGSGGDARHLVPMAGHMHREQHLKGIRTFQEHYHVDLLALAAELEARWQTEKGSE